MPLCLDMRPGEHITVGPQKIYFHRNIAGDHSYFRVDERIFSFGVQEIPLRVGLARVNRHQPSSASLVFLVPRDVRIMRGHLKTKEDNSDHPRPPSSHSIRPKATE